MSKAKESTTFSMNITVSRFYNTVGFTLAFGSLFFQPISKGGSIKKKFGHYFSWAFFWFLFFTKNWDFIRESLSLFSRVCYDLIFYSIFQLALQVQSWSHYISNIDVCHNFSIHIVAYLVCYYRVMLKFCLICSKGDWIVAISLYQTKSVKIFQFLMLAQSLR